MFSGRSYFPSRVTALAERQRQALAGCAEVIDLTVSNPTRAGLSYSAYDGLGASHSLLGGAHGVLYEPEALGALEARRAIAHHHPGAGARPSEEDVLLLPSSSEAYRYLFDLLCDPGDEVLAPEPSYPLFAHLAQLSSVRLVPYPLRYDGAWHIDLDAARSARTSRSRAVLVVSPNNPTGSRASGAELGQLAELGLPLIVDEVFAHYPLAADAEPTSALGQVPALTFCLDGLSKSAGLPQLKLSWLSASGPPAQRREAMRRLAWLADTYLATATPVQEALPRLLDAARTFRGALLPRLQGNLAALRRELAGSAATVLSVEAGWYAMVRLPGVADDERWATWLLEEAGVIVHPGYFYDLVGPPHCVVSLLCRPEQIAAGARSLRQLVECRSAG